MASRKTILYIAPFGFNERMANFSEFITARYMTKSNFDVYALTSSENGRSYKIDLNGINAYYYKNSLVGLYYLLIVLIKIQPDIIHITHLRNNRIGTIATILAKVFRNKIVFTEPGLLHDPFILGDRDDPLRFQIKPNSIPRTMREIFTCGKINNQSIIYNTENYFYHFALTHADKVAFISSHNLPIARTLGIQNAVVLPYFFDTDRWDNIKSEGGSSEFSEQIKRMKDKKFVLFMGQLKLRKGYDIFLKSIPHIPKDTVPYFALVTPSQKSESDFLTKEIEKLGIKDRVFVFRRITNSELKELYSNCQAVAMPSRYEGFGLATTEAFEFSKPVVASNVPAINEIVIDGENGLLVPPENPEELAKAITKVVTETNLKDKLVSGGHKTMEHLRSPALKEKWLKLYNDLIANK